jgi:endonuclease-3 related protein
LRQNKKKAYALLVSQELIAIYNALLEKYGNRKWWPAERPFEMIVGAILTQNVSWKNAALAISALRKAGLLSPEGIINTPIERLAQLLKPTRFMNLKAKRLKSFSKWYTSEYSAEIMRMAGTGISELRSKLLGVDGIGKETADCILLYACNQPVFVVDAYTLRIFGRLGLVDGKPSYDSLQAFFMHNLPKDVELYKDYHAQIVHLGKEVCRKEPVCDRCPLRSTAGGLQCLFAVRSGSE